ncbi:hypothetical protein LJK88_03295 [Paenibacillus sp. P26]|nr:hypothetical protein LJK88_03295 [Paenibacillus sp. P26]
MSKQVQAYFHTENEAEDVRIKLQAYPVDHIEVGAAPEALDRGTPLLFPFAAAAGTAAGPVGGYVAGATGTGATAGMLPRPGPISAFVPWMRICTITTETEWTTACCSTR